LEVDLSKKNGSLQSLEKSVESANSKYLQKSEEADRLRSELKIISEELVMLQERMKETQSSSNESQNQLLPLQYELSRCQQDKSFLEERLKSCENDLQARMRALAEEKSASSKMKFDLDTKIVELQTELSITKDRLKSTQDQLTTTQEKSSSYQQKLRELEEQMTKQQENFLQESEGLRRLNELQKRHLNEATDLISELESNLQAAKDNYSRQLNKVRDDAARRIESIEENALREKAELEGKIKELEAHIAEGPSSTPKNIVSMIMDEEDSSKQIATLKQSYGTDIYELYDRILKLEKEKIAEQDRRHEIEIYMQHVAKDIEQKAPIIAEQKRNYNRLLQSHELMSKKYDDLVNQNSQLQQKVAKLEQLKNEAVHESQAINQHNKDLSKQLQHLLKRSMEAQQGRTPTKKPVSIVGSDASSSTDAIGDYLVSFDNIEELQLRNAQLLQTIRKLEKDIEESSNQAEERAAEAASTALSSAMKEITALREQRQHTEELVIGLVQQRDMYKAMVQESGMLTITNTPSNRGEMLVPVGDIHTTPRTPGMMMNASTPTGLNASPSRGFQELQFKLTAAEDEKMKLKDRLARLEEAEKLLNDALTSLKAEASKLRVDSAMYASDAKFNKERALQLEEALKIATAENSAGMQRRLDIEKIVVEQQHAARMKDEQLRQLHDQLHAAQEHQRRAQIEVEVAHAAEQRLQDQVNGLREEMKRAASLSESVHRIEIGLSNRAAEEKSLLTTERDNALAAVEQLRKQVQDLSNTELERSSSLKQNLSNLETSLEERTKECAYLKDELVRERSSAVAAIERSHLLEKQLSLAQERLFASQGVKVMESLSDQQLTELQLALDQSNAQIASLKQQLQVAESYGEEYRKLSAATNATLQDLQQMLSNSKSSYEVEIQQLQATIATLQQESAQSNASTSTLLKEVEDAREQLRSAFKAHEQEKSILTEQFAQAQLSQEQVQGQIEQMKTDLVKFQSVAKTAHSNYERELNLHASAEKELHEVRDQLDHHIQMLRAEQEKSSSFTAELIRKEVGFQEQKARLESNLQDANARIDELSHINDSLHKQVHSLSAQVDKMLSSRGQGVESANSDETASADPSVAASTETVTAVSTSAAAIKTVDDSMVADLQQTVAELREVVRYMKRERDLLSAKLSLAEAESNRHMSALTVAHRSLDELRAQLTSMKESQEVKEGSMTMIATEELKRLQQDAQQMLLLRDSNAHLRQANEELMHRLAAMEADVKSLRASMQPLDEKIQRLSGEKAALEITSKQEAADATYWRERLQQLVTRYHEVDPEEHRLLKESIAKSSSAAQAAESKLDELKGQLEALKTSESASKASLEAKAAEVEQLQKTYDALEKNTGGLRTKLREMKSKYDEVAGKLVAKTKAEAELTKQVVSLTEQLANASKAVVAEPSTTSSVAPVAASEPMIITPAAPVAAVAPVSTPATSTMTSDMASEVAPTTTTSRKRPLEPESTAAVTTEIETPATAPLSSAEEIKPPVESAAASSTDNPAQSEKLLKLKETLRKRALEKASIAAAKPAAADIVTAPEAGQATSAAAPAAAEVPVAKKSKTEEKVPEVVAEAERSDMADNAEEQATETPASASAVDPSMEEGRLIYYVWALLLSLRDSTV
jgi:nucleoprotein TPR